MTGASLKGKPKRQIGGEIGVVKAIFDDARRDLKREKYYLSLKNPNQNQEVKKRKAIRNATDARSLLEFYGTL